YIVPKLKSYSATSIEVAAAECIAACRLEAADVHSEPQYKAFRDRWLGRKDGILTQVNDLWLKAAPKEAKREVGQRVNRLKTEVEAKVEAALTQPATSVGDSAIDISLPGIRRPIAPNIRSFARRTKLFGCSRTSAIRSLKG